MTEILLNDLLGFDDETMERVKIRFKYILRHKL